MISFEKFESQYTWKERRGSVDSFFVPGMDVEEYGWSIIAKKNGAFFVKGYRAGGGEARLPFQEFATVEDAKTWIAHYDYDRQAKFSRRERSEITF